MFDPKVHSIFVAHGAVVDLKVMDIYDVPYICTLVVDSISTDSSHHPYRHQCRKLKDLCKKYLNAKIQEGHHSSIIDSRACLALFHKVKKELHLEEEGPHYLLKNDLYGMGMRKRRRKKATESQAVNRLAFKCLDTNTEVTP